MEIPIRYKPLFTLCFAEDQVVIAKDEEEVSYILRKLKVEYEQSGLEINFDKTEYLEINNLM